MNCHVIHEEEYKKLWEDHCELARTRAERIQTRADVCRELLADYEEYFTYKVTHHKHPMPFESWVATELYLSEGAKNEIDGF